jgi:predicted RNA-binding protein with PIN domain
MPFVIDGYNLLHAMGLLGGPVGPNQLAKARAGLLGLVASIHLDDPATIVFDARRAPAGIDTEETHGPVRVEFATTEEADDRIEWLIAHDPAPKRLVVVSDDQRLRQAAKRRGCPAWKCEEYLTWLDKERRKRRVRPATEKPAAAGPMETDRWLEAFRDVDHDPAWDELFGPFDESEP